jgi:hypothetical protein
LPLGSNYLNHKTLVVPKGGKKLGSDGVEELPTPISAALFLTGDLREGKINFLVVPT